MGWSGKHDFTVLNNGVLRKGNDLVTRQKVCETLTCNIIIAVLRRTITTKRVVLGRAI